MYIHIAVKVNQHHLDVTGRSSIVSIASTATGTCGISKFFCSYLSIFDRCLAQI